MIFFEELSVASFTGNAPHGVRWMLNFGFLILRLRSVQVYDLRFLPKNQLHDTLVVPFLWAALKQVLHVYMHADVYRKTSHTHSITMQLTSGGFQTGYSRPDIQWVTSRLIKLF